MMYGALNSSPRGWRPRKFLRFLAAGLRPPACGVLSPAGGDPFS